MDGFAQVEERSVAGRLLFLRDGQLLETTTYSICCRPHDLIKMLELFKNSHPLEKSLYKLSEAIPILLSMS
jgi:hypothetical protein